LAQIADFASHVRARPTQIGHERRLFLNPPFQHREPFLDAWHPPVVPPRAIAARFYIVEIAKLDRRLMPRGARTSETIVKVYLQVRPDGYLH
jgi:hypothetical protein